MILSYIVIWFLSQSFFQTDSLPKKVVIEGETYDIAMHQRSRHLPGGHWKDGLVYYEGLHFQNQNDTLFGRPAPVPEYEKEPDNVIAERWTTEDVLFMVNPLEEMETVVRSSVNDTVLNNLSRENAIIEITVLVDSTGRSIECKQFLEMDHFEWSDSFLSLLVAVERYVKNELLFEDNGMLHMADLPYGHTRIRIYFRSDTIEIKPFYYIFSPEVYINLRYWKRLRHVKAPAYCPVS